MKKFIALCLSLLLIGSTIICGIATGNATIEISCLAAAPGEEVVIPVLINNNPGINTFTLGFEYDTTRLRLDNVTLCDGVPGQFTYKKKAVWLNSQDIDYSGEFLNLHFTVLDDAPAGEGYITVTYISGDICNYDEEDINFGVLPGGIEVVGNGGNDSSASAYGLSDATGGAGDRVSVYASISGNPGIISLRNQISYDERVMELVAVNDLQLLGGYTEPSPEMKSPYTLRWADSISAADNTDNGDFAELIFEIRDDAETGEYEVSIEHIESRNVAGESIDFSDATAKITVEASVKGDVNLDGEVNAEDSELLNKYLAAWAVEINNTSSDIDEDGEITDWDAILLERYLAGWNVEEFN